MASVTIYANQMAVISGSDTSLNRHGNETEIVNYGEYALVGFNVSDIPKGAILQPFSIRLYCKITTKGTSVVDPSFWIYNLKYPFNQNSVTYENKPAKYGRETAYGKSIEDSPFSWIEFYSRDSYFSEKINGLKNGLWTFASINGVGSVTLEIKSPTSDKKPEAVIQYNSPTVRVSPGFTDGLFVPKNIAKSVSWSFGYDTHAHMIGTPEQVSAEVRCKSGGTTKTIYVTGSATTATIPAGTFTESSGQIQIAIATTAGGYAESNWITVNTTDSTGTAVAISPRGVKIDGDAAQVFSWTYESPTGTPQTKAELQVSYDGGGRWQELTSAQGDVRQTTVPAGTLEAGAAAWRVRCFNSDGTPGEYSDGAYIIVAKNPSPPSYVTTNAKPRLTVEWASSRQQGYQVKVMRAEKILFDSGTVFGLDKQLTLPDFLADGSFTAQVRIIDKQGLWSEWTKIDGSVQNVPAESISAKTKKEQFGLTVEWSTDGEYQAFYLLRDGVPIGKATGREWTDWTANGKHKYTVRGVKGDGYYTDSDTVVGVTAVPYGAICLWDDFTHWMLLKLHEGGPFVHTENRSAGIEYVQYEGRALPVAYETGWKTVSHAVEYTVRKATEWEALKVMEGQMVIYKDYRGARVIGMLESVDAEHTKRINFSLTIQETDVQERVAYD